MLEHIAYRARRVPAAIRITLMMAGGILGVYWAVTTSGPYPALASVQASLFSGEHYPRATAIATVLAGLVPGTVAVQLLAFGFKRKEEPRRSAVDPTEPQNRAIR